MNIQLAEIARIAETLAPFCEGDEQLFSDMIEGETDVHYYVTRLHNQIAADQELVTGITERAADLAERKRRLSERMTANKAAIGQFLRAAQLGKIELPEATYSVRDGKPSLRIVDPDAVPEGFTRAKIEPDKTAINAAFEGIDDLPNWLTRGPARDVVTARTK